MELVLHVFVLCVVAVVIAGTDTDHQGACNCVCVPGTTPVVIATRTRKTKSDVSLNLVGRSAWGARSHRSKSKLVTPSTKVVIHHTTGPPCITLHGCSQLVRVRERRRKRHGVLRWVDVRYNFLVGEDGRVYEGRGWDKMGAHASSYNLVSHGIAVIGDFKNRQPMDAALKAIRALITEGVRKGKIRSDYAIIGHRDVGDTKCPGDKLYETISQWKEFERPTTAPEINPLIIP